MEENSGYVLAMYDVRGKQNFIYKSQKIKEIIGGSKIIEDVFKDYLYPAAKKYYGMDEKDICNESVQVIYDYHNKSADINESADTENKNKFSSENFKHRMDEGNYIGEVVYEGGGNFFVLYRDAETCVEVNKIFTARLLREISTLKVLCTYITINDFSDYKSDRDRLYKLHRRHEAQESVIYPVNTLPFVQTAPESNRPYTDMMEKVKGEGEKKVTSEQGAKYKKYFEWTADNKDKEEENKYDKEEVLLDKLVEARGIESLLAVIYIDGNGIGAKVQKCLEGDASRDEAPKKTYDECVTALRKFSADIQRDYVDQRIRKINNALEEKYEKKNIGNAEDKKEKVRRTIVKAGDEMTIICNAHDALDVVRAYFAGLPEGDSSCAGIAIFHSHAPYADAYSIAEECCESCKTYMKNAENAKKDSEKHTDEISDQSFMDFHYCQGGIGISLESIRKRESGGQLYSRPWRIDKVEGNKTGEKVRFTPVFNNAELELNQNGQTESGDNYGGLVDSFATELNKTARGNVKTLRNAAQQSTQELIMELKRIKAHSTEDKKMDIYNEKKDKPPIKQTRDLIYDISMVYDLWFAKEEQDDNETSDTED